MCEAKICSLPPHHAETMTCGLPISARPPPPQKNTHILHIFKYIVINVSLTVHFHSTLSEI